MKRFFLLFYLFLIVSGANLYAQDFSIKSVDGSNYPLIKVNIEFPDTAYPDISKIKIIESGDSLEFSADSIPITKNEKAICLLIEPQLFSTKQKTEYLMNIINDIESTLSPGDKLNIIITTNKKKSPGCIEPISFEFTSNVNGLSDYFHLNLPAYQNLKRSSIGKDAINESVDFIRMKWDLPSKKLLMILSNSIGDSTENLSEIRAVSNKYGIMIKLLKLLPDTGIDNYFKESSQLNLIELLDSAFSERIGTSKIDKQIYELGFYTKQKGKINQFEIKYNQTKRRSSYTLPANEKEFFQGNFTLIVIFAVLFLLIIFFIVILLYMKRQMFNLAAKLKDSSNKSKENDSLNLSYSAHLKTNSSEMQTPSLSIEIYGNKTIYELKKSITSIGREEDNDIVIQDLTISGHHAEIVIENGEFLIQDNLSTNGTFVNEMKISKVMVKNGDIIKLGKAKMVLIC
jgi:hypothetical protein